MQKLYVDIETYSQADLLACGLHKYAERSELLLFGYAFNDDPVKVIDFTERDLPAIVKIALQDKDYLKIAHSAHFEIENLEPELDIILDPRQWWCTMTKCAMTGLPLSLEKAGQVLKLKQQKLSEGRALISYFCKPCKATKANGMRTRNLPHHNREKWERFKVYLTYDVEAARGVAKATSFLSVPRNEKLLWELDHEINRRGVMIDRDLVNNAIAMDKIYRAILVKEAIKITSLENPNSRDQLKSWLEEETDEDIPDLKKATVLKLLDKFDNKKVNRVLTIKQELSKTSVTKYKKMLQVAGHEDRLRGTIQFYGAGRTGRGAGRLVQPQNFPKGKYHDNILDIARDLLLANDYDGIQMFFGAVPDTLSQLLRSALIPKPGHRFIVSDFSAIEARVIAWLAGEKWRLDVFNTHGKIYEASAAQMFKVPIESVTKSSDYRAKSKIAELALGYQGGVNALINMGAYDMGLKEEELQPIVNAWRGANPMIKQFWYDMGRGAVQAIKTGQRITLQKGITFHYTNSHLFMGLPSGRSLCYYNAFLGDGKYGPEVRYWGMNQKVKKWSVIKTYGGSLVENATQAIARDCLMNGLLNLRDGGYKTVLHIHDETVNEVPENWGSLEEVNKLMIKPAPWMRGLPMAAEGFEGYYYKKD